jgi:hypothetical protein
MVRLDGEKEEGKKGTGSGEEGREGRNAVKVSKKESADVE